MRTLLLWLSCGIVANAIAGATVSNVTMPRLHFANPITISYDLVGDRAIVTLDILTNGVSIGAANVVRVSGDVNRKVEPGNGKSIVWQAYQDWPDHRINNQIVQAKVTAWSLDNPPDVMVVDLLTKSNIVFYASLASLPGGVTNDLYKTDKLVMRKIPAGGSVFSMGEAGGSGAAKPHFVAFTNDFYLGVYEVTQKQLSNVSGQRGTSSFAESENADIMPSDALPFGNSGDSWSIRDYRYNASTYPQGIGKFGNKSFLGAFCRHSGLAFDLPTGAQWEFACRAGTSTKYNNGSNDASSMDALGWYGGNSGSVPHPVGMKTHNAFGLYDMHGNVWEWVLDWAYSSAQNPYTAYDVNPVGPASEANNLKERRGGGYLSEGASCGSVSRSNVYVVNTSVTSGGFGFRLWAPAKMW